MFSLRSHTVHILLLPFMSIASSAIVQTVPPDTSQLTVQQLQHEIYLGGRTINNPGRYLELLPPINGATAASATPYFTENPGDPFEVYDISSVRYSSGPGGVTPPCGGTGAQGSVVPSWAPDLRGSEQRVTGAILVNFQSIKGVSCSIYSRLFRYSSCFS